VKKIFIMWELQLKYWDLKAASYISFPSIFSVFINSVWVWCIVNQCLTTWQKKKCTQKGNDHMKCWSNLRMVTVAPFLTLLWSQETRLPIWSWNKTWEPEWFLLMILLLWKWCNGVQQFAWLSDLRRETAQNTPVIPWQRFFTHGKFYVTFFHTAPVQLFIHLASLRLHLLLDNEIGKIINS
jgi:hypothetical protein